MTAGASSSTNMATARTILSYAFLAVALVLIVVAVAKQRDEFLEAVGQLSASAIVLALGAGAVALWATLLAWRESIAATTQHLLPLGPSVHTFFVSQLGKYVPGAVWPVAAQMELMKQYGVGRSRTSTGSVLSMVVGVGTAVVVGTAGVVVAGETIDDFWWLFPIAVACGLVMVPQVLRRFLRALSRIHPRFAAFGTVEIHGRRLVMCGVWSGVAWVAWGTHAWLILHSLTQLGVSGLPFAIGAFALAWVVGFVVVIAPGGIGPREAALVVLLTAVASSSEALALAVISRVLMALLDLVAAAVAMVVPRPPELTQQRS